MSTAAEFRDYLTEFSEHYASLGNIFILFEALALLMILTPSVLR